MKGWASALPTLSSKDANAKCECLLYCSSLFQVPKQRCADAGIRTCHEREEVMKNMNNRTMTRYAPIFLLPTMIAFAIGFIAPFFLGVYLSFCEFTTVTDAKFVGFKNYIGYGMIQVMSFLHSLWYSPYCLQS